MENHSFDTNTFTREKHVKYFIRFLHLLPGSLSSYDSTRLSIAFFALSGLDVLNAIDELDTERKKQICDWIYLLQVLPTKDGEMEKCGFQGASTFITKAEPKIENCSDCYSCGHLAYTYTGLASLVILGDDLSRVNKSAVLKGIRALQQKDGSFCAHLLDSENDMRFVYCATSVCYMLQDWSGMDIQKTVDFIRRSMSYDYGFGQGPELESHGGATYCAVASLALLDELENVTPKQIKGLRTWAIMRQISGFQGRANKPVDTCYSFWVGATLKILNIYDQINFEENRRYILGTQDPLIGGFSRAEHVQSDPLHTYLGICGLTLMDEEGLLPINPALNITLRATEHLKAIHKLWNLEYS